MSRVYYKRMSTSANPSRANWDTDQPRDCKTCGGRLRITLDRIWFRRFPVLESFHMECV